MTEVRMKIDWFSCSTLNYEQPKFPPNFVIDYTPISAIRGYQMAFQYSDGRIVAQSEKQGTFVQYSGKTLNVVPLDALGIIRFHRGNGYKPSRIDLAIDAFDSGLSINALYKAVQHGEHESKAKKGSIIDSIDGGKTLYVGSRTSEAFLRVYDKGIESQQGGDWKRLELELKGSKAVNACDAMLRAKDIDGFITGAIRGFCDFPSNMNWMKIVKAEKVLVKSDKQKSGDTRAWLMSQVVQSLAKTYLMGDTEIIADFMQELSSILTNAEKSELD